MAWVVKRGLNHGVIAGKEMELDYVSWGSDDGIGVISEAGLANINGMGAA